MAFLEAEDFARVAGQIVRVDVEEFVTRIGLNGGQQFLAGLGPGRESETVQYRGHLVPDDRDLKHGPACSAGGEKANKARFPGGITGHVKPQEADFVQVGVPEDCGTDARLREGQGRTGGPRHGGALQRPDLLPVPEEPEPGPRPRREDRQSGVVVQAIPAVPEKKEVAVVQPQQQILGLLHGCVAGRSRAGIQVGNFRSQVPVDGCGILGGRPNIGQDRLEIQSEPVGTGLIRQPGDFDGDPGFRAAQISSRFRP